MPTQLSYGTFAHFSRRAGTDEQMGEGKFVGAAVALAKEGAMKAAKRRGGKKARDPQPACSDEIRGCFFDWGKSCLTLEFCIQIFVFHLTPILNIPHHLIITSLLVHQLIKIIHIYINTLLRARTRSHSYCI